MTHTEQAARERDDMPEQIWAWTFKDCDWKSAWTVADEDAPENATAYVRKDLAAIDRPFGVPFALLSNGAGDDLVERAGFIGEPCPYGEGTDSYAAFHASQRRLAADILARISALTVQVGEWDAHDAAWSERVAAITTENASLRARRARRDEESNILREALFVFGDRARMGRTLRASLEAYGKENPTRHVDQMIAAFTDWPKEEVAPGVFADVDPETLARTESQANQPVESIAIAIGRSLADAAKGERT